MPYNFLRCDHDQPFLLPPDLRDWLPAGHLAWFGVDFGGLDYDFFCCSAPMPPGGERASAGELRATVIGDRDRLAHDIAPLRATRLPAGCVPATVILGCLPASHGGRHAAALGARHHWACLLPPDGTV
jgi:hypothetical protein